MAAPRLLSGWPSARHRASMRYSYRPAPISSFMSIANSPSISTLMQGNSTMRRLPTLLLLSLSISLSGCAGGKDRVLPDDGRSIKRIYDQHFSDIGLHGTLAARQA